VCNLGRNPAICLRQEAIFVIGTKALVSRDLWPWPRPWAPADYRVQVWWRSSFGVVVAIPAKKFTDTRTHRQTNDRRRAIALAHSIGMS